MPMYTDYDPRVDRGCVIRRLCAWCGQELGDKPGGGDDVLTHGICEDCSDRMVASSLTPGTRVRRRGGSPAVGEVVRQLATQVMVLFPNEREAMVHEPRSLEVIR